MTLDYSFFGSLNFFQSLNGLRRAGKYVYNERALAELSPRVREDLLKTYYHGLGITEKNAFNQHVKAYFNAQEEAFDKVLARYPLSLEQKKSLKDQLIAQQKPITRSAIAFDNKMPGQAPTAVHPDDFKIAANQEKLSLLEETKKFQLDPLLNQLQDMLHPSNATPKTKQIKQKVLKKIPKIRPPVEPKPPTTQNPPPPPPPPPRAPKPHEHSFEKIDMDFFADDTLGGELKVRNRLKAIQTIIQLEAKQKTSTLTNEEDFQLNDLKNRYNQELIGLTREKYGKRYLEQLATAAQLKTLDLNNPPDSLNKQLNELIEARVQARFEKQKQLIEAATNDLNRPLNAREINQLAAQEVVEAKAQKEAYEAQIAAQKQARTAQNQDDANDSMHSDPDGAPPPDEAGTIVDLDGAPPPANDEDQEEFEEIEVEETVEVPDDTAVAAPPVDLDLDKIKSELEAEQKKARDNLEKKLNESVNNLHVAAQRERDLIGWLLATEVALKRIKQHAFFSTTPSDYTVMMTGDVHDKVQKLQQTLQKAQQDSTMTSENVQNEIAQAGGLRAPSGLDIIVSKNGKTQQLTFSVKFPPLFMQRSFYTDPKHHSQATLLFQAALVRYTGAETILTNINHTNQKMATQLAREAFVAAQKVGYQPDEITIQINGKPIKREDLFEETLDDLQSPHQQAPKFNINMDPLVKLDQEIQNSLKPTSEQKEEAQSLMKQVLNKERSALGLEKRTTDPARQNGNTP